MAQKVEWITPKIYRGSRLKRRRDMIETLHDVTRCLESDIPLKNHHGCVADLEKVVAYLYRKRKWLPG